MTSCLGEYYIYLGKTLGTFKIAVSLIVGLDYHFGEYCQSSWDVFGREVWASEESRVWV